MRGLEYLDLDDDDDLTLFEKIHHTKESKIIKETEESKKAREIRQRKEIKERNKDKNR